MLKSRARVPTEVLQAMDQMNLAISTILSDKQLLEHLTKQVFQMIDVNGDGDL